MSFTPGPWTFARRNEKEEYDILSGDRVIAHTKDPGDCSGEAAYTNFKEEHAKGNAQLMSSAPFLVIALRSIIALTNNRSDQVDSSFHVTGFRQHDINQIATQALERATQ